MIFGLPIQSWLLMILSVGIGLVIAVLFYMNNRDRTPKGWEQNQ